MIPRDNIYTDFTFIPTSDYEYYTPIKSYVGALIQPEEVNPFIAPLKTLSDTITIATTVYDEFGDPLPGANISIDGKAIASTYNNGTVTVPGIATSTSTVTITYVGMKPYSVSAVFLPKTVRMQRDITQLDEVIITIPKKIETLTPPTPPVVAVAPKPTAEPSKTNWLLWIGVAGLGFKVYQKMTSGTTVKAKI